MRQHTLLNATGRIDISSPGLSSLWRRVKPKYDRKPERCSLSHLVPLTQPTDLFCSFSPSLFFFSSNSAGEDFQLPTSLSMTSFNSNIDRRSNQLSEGEVRNQASMHLISLSLDVFHSWRAAMIGLGFFLSSFLPFANQHTSWHMPLASFSRSISFSFLLLEILMSQRIDIYIRLTTSSCAIGQVRAIKTLSTSLTTSTTLSLRK